MIATATGLAADNRPFFGSLLATLPFELRRALRNRRYLIVGIALPVMLYLVFSNTKGAQIATPAEQARFMVGMAVFGAIGASLGAGSLVAQERTTGWMRQLRITPLHPAAHLVAKLAVSYLVTVPALLAIAALARAAGHVALSPTEWALTLGGLALGVLPFAELGLLIGYVFDGTSTQGASTVVYMSLAILGGLWMPIASLPSALQTLAGFMPSYHLADLGSTAATAGRLDAADLGNLALCTVALGVVVAWRYARATAKA